MESKHKAMKYPLDRKSKTYLIAVHYLFDLHLSPVKVAHVLGVDIGYACAVFVEESRYRD